MSQSSVPKEGLKRTIGLFRSIRTKLIIHFSFLFAVVLIGVVFVGLFGMPFTKGSGRLGWEMEEAFNRLNLIADLKKERLLQWIEERREDIQLATKSDMVRANVVRLIDEIGEIESRGKRGSELLALVGGEKSYRNLVNYLELLITSYGVYHKAYITEGQSGRVIVIAARAGVNSYISTNEPLLFEPLHTRATYVGNIQFDSVDKREEFRFSRPIVDNEGNAAAVLVLEVSVDDILTPTLHTGEGLGKRGEALLVNQDVRILNSLKHPLADGTIAKPLEYQIKSKPATLAARGEEGIIEAEDYRGVPVLAAYRYIPITSEFGWGMVVKRDRAEVFSSLYKDIAYSLWIGLGAILFVAVLTIALARNLTRPILSLNLTARKVSGGNLDARAPVTSSDEVGQLAAAFNSMVQRIQKWYEELDERVNMRTAELEEEITERKRAEETLTQVHSALQESKQYLESLIESSGDAIISTDREGNVVLFNKGAEELLGYRAEEVLGGSVVELYESREQAKEVMHKMREGGGTASGFETTLRAKDGSPIPVLISASMLYDEDGNEAGTVGFNKDLRERKRAEEAVREAQAFYEQLIGEAGDAIVALDRDSTIVTWNLGAEKLFGYEAHEMIGRHGGFLVPDEELERAKAIRREVLAGRTLRDELVQRIRKDATRIDGLVTYSPLRDQEGRVTGICSMFKDITERRRAEEAEAEARAYADSIVETVRQPLVVLDADLRVVSANRAFYETFQVSPEETESRLIYDLGNRQWDVPRLRELLEEILPQNTEFEGFEIDHEFETIGRRVMLLNARRVYQEAEATQMILLAIEDLTERKRAEEALIESEERFRSVTQSAVEAIISADGIGTILSWNDAAHTIFGYSEKEALGENVAILIPEQYREAHKKALDRVSSGGEPKIIGRTIELNGLNKDGSEFPVEMSLSAWESDGRTFYGAVVRDITERKRAEERLERAHEELKQAYDTLEKAQASAIAAEKLAALGRLTAGVSHEVLNPLNIISLIIQRLLDEPDINPELAEDLRGIEEQGNRIIKIAKGLLAFSRQRPPERQPIKLNETVTKTLALLQYDLKLQNIDVEMNLAEDLPPVPADEDQLQQVVLNLLTNARDVMPEGGRLTLSTAELEPLFANRERAVEFRVEDTGPGIPPENMDKLFEPFFTTKPVGSGTGLGLSVCQGIIESHGGVIWAENVPEGGAVFIVHLNVGIE